jgi:hypothetical protein
MTPDEKQMFSVQLIKRKLHSANIGIAATGSKRI